MLVSKKSTDKATTLELSIPSEIFLTLRETESQFVADMKKFTAFFLFQNRKLSIGQCAEFADMTEEDFIYFLSENNVSIFEYLDAATIKEELANA